MGRGPNEYTEAKEQGIDAYLQENFLRHMQIVHIYGHCMVFQYVSPQTFIYDENIQSAVF